MNGVFIVSQDGGHLLFHKVWGVCAHTARRLWQC